MPSPTMVVEKIDDARAALYLAKLSKIQRSLKPTVVERYAEEMVQGRWPLTHQPIAFDADDAMIDGQHRLQAVRLANKRKPGIVIDFYVARDCDPETYSKIDMHAVRDAADLFVCEYRGANNGERPKNAKDTTSMAASMLRGVSEAKARKEEIAKSAYTNLPLLVDYLAILRPNDLWSSGVGAGFAACAKFFGDKHVKPLAERWSKEIWESDNDPLRALRDKLFRRKLAANSPRARREALAPHEVYAVTLSAVRAALAGDKPSHLIPTTRDLGADVDRRLKSQLQGRRQAAS